MSLGPPWMAAFPLGAFDQTERDQTRAGPIRELGRARCAADDEAAVPAKAFTT